MSKKSEKSLWDRLTAVGSKEVGPGSLGGLFSYVNRYWWVAGLVIFLRYHSCKTPTNTNPPIKDFNYLNEPSRRYHNLRDENNQSNPYRGRPIPKLDDVSNPNPSGTTPETAAPIQEK